MQCNLLLNLIVLTTSFRKIKIYLITLTLCLVKLYVGGLFPVQHQSLVLEMVGHEGGQGGEGGQSALLHLCVWLPRLQHQHVPKRRHQFFKKSFSTA